jgi:hypothetical protein
MGFVMTLPKSDLQRIADSLPDRPKPKKRGRPALSREHPNAPKPLQLRLLPDQWDKLQVIHSIAGTKSLNRCLQLMIEVVYADLTRNK